MKKYIIWLLCLFIYSNTIQAQTNTYNSDSSITLKVSGLCEMCKTRIEDALKTKGILKAVWDIDTKILSVVYDSKKINQTKIENIILSKGHDVENKKARNGIYESLPDCCKYRDVAESELNKIVGIVLSENDKGEFKVLQNVTVVWLKEKTGTVTNEKGVFKIKKSDLINDSLVFSYVGFLSDTVEVKKNNVINVYLHNEFSLGNVFVNTQRRTRYSSTLSTIRSQFISEKELFKAACCNLSESFETNPSVDVTFNDAITGSKQIQLLGLSGIYSQLTVENLPGPRGLAIANGLNTIAGAWIESIQLTKGAGSVVNGFESMAGQINIELKKPETAAPLFFNVYRNAQGKTDLNLNLSKKINSKWSTALLLHDNFLVKNRMDFNNDGFKDLPTGNLFSLFNRWNYQNNKGLISQFGVKYLSSNQLAGDERFNPLTDKLNTTYYGVGLNSNRLELFSKIGYVFPEKKYKSIGLQLSTYKHSNESYFGTTIYNATQNNFYANLIYQSIISNSAHKFRTGISFVSDKYSELFKTTHHNRTENVVGSFFEYTFDKYKNFNFVAGLRIDHNNIYGTFITPRLHVRYQPFTKTTLRFSSGKGQRTANIFAENNSVFVSSRQLQIIPSLTNGAYGLQQEISWNHGVTLDQKFKLFKKPATFVFDYFRTDFKNQVVVDLENPREISFYNLNGKSFSNSFQSELNFTAFKNVDIRLAYRYFQVKTTYNHQLLNKPLQSFHRAFVNLEYNMNDWKFDATFNYNGKKRIPSTTQNPVQYQFANYSNPFVIINSQISKTVGRLKRTDIYLGAENIGNVYQKNVIIANDQPFGNYFDASLVWGPITGSMIYLGVRIR